MDDLENASGEDFEKALRSMVSISRYETRTFSKSKRALHKLNG